MNILTPLDVCNQALRKLGHATITSFNPSPETKEADICRRLYPSSRDAVLELHAWNFALKRAILKAYSEPSTTLTPSATSGSGVTFDTVARLIFDHQSVNKRLHAKDVAGKALIVALATRSPVASLTPADGALTPRATAVTFTASNHAFSSMPWFNLDWFAVGWFASGWFPDGNDGDAGFIIENLNGAGAALITTYVNTMVVQATILTAWESTVAMISGQWRVVRTDRVTADITEVFPSTVGLVAGSWRLYNPVPPYEYEQSITIPSDMMRIKQDVDSPVFQREGDYILAHSEEISVRYVQHITDLTKWPPHVIETLVARLAMDFAEPITSQLAKRQEFSVWFEGRDDGRPSMLQRAIWLDEGEKRDLPSAMLVDDLIFGRQ